MIMSVYSFSFIDIINIFHYSTLNKMFLMFSRFILNYLVKFSKKICCCFNFDSIKFIQGWAKVGLQL